MPLSEIERVEDQLRYCTPYWAGGARKDASGVWRLPGPGEFRGCAKILNKQMRLVPLLPHPWQLEFDDELERQRAAGMPMRAIVLKARKLGFSTWIAEKFLQRLTQIAYQRAVVVAQDVKTAGDIFQMAKLTYQHLPTVEQLGLGFSIKPPIIREGSSQNGRKHMVFGEASRQLRNEGLTGESIFEVDTAQSPTSGRGGTFSLVHLSEVAFWEDKQALGKMLAMLEAVPYELETIVCLESTANGLNHFYRRWVSAREGALDPDSGEAYVPIFVPWWRDQNCARRFATDEARLRFEETVGDERVYGEIATDEPMLITAYGCTLEQLYWRRMKIREHPESKTVDTFNQENPHSDEAAFIGSGHTVFPGLLVTKAIKQAEAAPQPISGSLRVVEWKERRSRAGTVNVPVGVDWMASEAMGPDDPELLVWEHPVKGGGEWPEDVPQEDRVDGAYVVAVDVAEGEANTFTKGDFHCIQVFDHRTQLQVAIHASRMDMHLLPLFVVTVAVYYNNAWLAVEVNSIGTAVADPIQKDYRYPRMVRRKRWDKVLNVEQDLVGWRTDPTTKPMMEQTFASALDSDTMGGLRDIVTARQIATYIITERGKHEAQTGEHDDRLMAAMIAHRVMETQHPPRKQRRPVRRRRPVDPITGY